MTFRRCRSFVLLRSIRAALTYWKHSFYRVDSMRLWWPLCTFRTELRLYFAMNRPRVAQFLKLNNNIWCLMAKFVKFRVRDVQSSGEILCEWCNKLLKSNMFDNTVYRSVGSSFVRSKTISCRQIEPNSRQFYFGNNSLLLRILYKPLTVSGLPFEGMWRLDMSFWNVKRSKRQNAETSKCRKFKPMAPTQRKVEIFGLFWKNHFLNSVV